MSQVPTNPGLQTKAEREANAVRLAAEAEKATAEAARERAATRREVAMAREAELKAKVSEDSDQARRAGDEYHHVYRFEGQVGEGSVNKCISKLTEWHRLDDDCTIEIIFSSPGGSIFDGMKLFDFIVELGKMGHKTITGGIGMAASMAGILVQAGQTRYITRECWLLIHRASFGAIGSTYEVEDKLKLISRIEKRIIQIFVDRSSGKLTRAKIKRNWDRKDWWLSSDECLELGLIDEVRGIPGLGDEEEPAESV
jgi:ATP-dependent Clp endopeptidase proteolytic subunit ClpP